MILSPTPGALAFAKAFVPGARAVAKPAQAHRERHVRERESAAPAAEPIAHPIPLDPLAEHAISSLLAS